MITIDSECGDCYNLKVKNKHAFTEHINELMNFKIR
jgi:hypothetical protein